MTRAQRGVVKRTLRPSSLFQYSHWGRDLFAFGEQKDRVCVSDRRGFVIISLFLFRGGGQEIYNCIGGVVRKTTAFFPFFFPPAPHRRPLAQIPTLLSKRRRISAPNMLFTSVCCPLLKDSPQKFSVSLEASLLGQHFFVQSLSLGHYLSLYVYSHITDNLHGFSCRERFIEMVHRDVYI